MEPYDIVRREDQQEKLIQTYILILEVLHRAPQHIDASILLWHAHHFRKRLKELRVLLSAHSLGFKKTDFERIVEIPVGLDPFGYFPPSKGGNALQSRFINADRRKSRDSENALEA